MISGLVFAMLATPRANSGTRLLFLINSNPAWSFRGSVRRATRCELPVIRSVVASGSRV